MVTVSKDLPSSELCWQLQQAAKAFAEVCGHAERGAPPTHVPSTC